MRNKNALIFGAGGQDGFYLSRLLEQKGLEAIKTSRTDIQLPGDVADPGFVENLIKQYLPDFIFHLAANSTTRHSALFENHSTISTGTLNILESARLYCPETRIFLAGSAMQFKNDGIPINEFTPFEASSSYAVSRIQSVYAGRYFRQSFGLSVYTGYLFHHDSPLRNEQHINQKIVKAAQRIASGSTEKLLIGDINVRKEFNYAGDIVEAIWTLVNQENIFEAVIGSGKTYSIMDWLICCFNKKGLNWEDAVVIQKDFISEYQVLVSDPELIMGLGWQSKINFQQLANLMIDA